MHHIKEGLEGCPETEMDDLSALSINVDKLQESEGEKPDKIEMVEITQRKDFPTFEEPLVDNEEEKVDPKT